MRFRNAPLSGRNENVGRANTRKRGRPSLEENEVTDELPKVKRSRPCLPLHEELRLDLNNHMPQWSAVRGQCKNTNSKETSRLLCTKCNVPLCFDLSQNCYVFTLAINKQTGSALNLRCEMHRVTKWKLRYHIMKCMM